MNINPLNNFFQQNKKQLLWFLSISILAFPILIITNIVIGSSDLQLNITAPQSVEIDYPVEIEINISNPDQIAGYELLFQFDKEAVEFAGLYAGNEDAMPLGREMVILDEVPQGAAFGVYTCHIEGCVQPSDEQPNPSIQSADEELETIRLRLLPLKAGTLKVGLESARFVDKNGEPVDVEINQSTVEVKVLDNGLESPDVIENSTEPWDVPALPAQTRSAAVLPTLEAVELDRNSDGMLSFIDVVETTLVWKELRQAGDICSLTDDNVRFDVNSDGCLDIVDIQLMALHKDSQNPIYANQGRRATNGLTFTVNTTSDEADNVYGDGVCATAAGECTLRAAIMESNAQSGPNSIHFNIPGAGVQTIELSANLPTINDMTGGVTIDGFTQPGSIENTDELANNSTILIEVKGPDHTVIRTLTITSKENVFRGLAFYNSANFLNFYENNSQYNRVIGSFVGTDSTGTHVANRSVTGSGHGIVINQGANHNTIGTPLLADRNVLSGAGSRAIIIDHDNSDHNVIQNNIMGLNPSGTARNVAAGYGIDVQWGPSHNIIGGLGFRERNVISGNSYVAVDLSHNQRTSNNFVSGNFMGTDLTGTQVFTYTANGFGVLIKDDPLHNHIHDNVIAGNTRDAIWMKHNYNGRNYFYNNRVGVGANGETLGNAGRAMFLTGHNFEIGPGNIFAGNRGGGIYISNYLGSGPNDDPDNSDENRIFQNSFYDNGGLAIDIEPAGFNVNDENDLDEGPNGLLNSPVITVANENEIAGTACASCIVEIYISDSLTSFYGEGRLYIGQATADGTGAFSFPITDQIQVGQMIVALAIDPAGNTSEFSRTTQVSDGSFVPVDLAQNLALNKPATQSTQYSDRAASFAVDGNVSGNWSNGSVASTGFGTAAEPSWWEVDLGEVSHISTINIWNRTDCCSSRTSDVHVFVSDVPFEGVTVESSQNQAGVSDFFLPGAAPAFSEVAINRSGRYVRVQLAATNYLSLGEVEVFGYPIQNLALDKPTYQPSTWSSGGFSELAVDGNTSGFWVDGSVTHTQFGTAEQPMWWDVDLINISEISDIHIWNRQDCCSSRLSDFHIFVSDVPFEGNTLESSLNQAGVGNFFFTGAVGSDAVVPINRSGRYIRIQLTSTDVLSLAEVEIIGHASSSSNSPAPDIPFPTLTPIATGTPIPEIVPTQTPTPQPTTEANVIAVDSFSRSSSTGWGLAEKGGAYTHLWGASAANDFSADGSTGLLTLSSGGTAREANLNGISVLDSVSEVTVSFDTLANANSFMRLQTRMVNNNTTYRATYQVSSNGIANGFVDRLANGSWAKVGQTASLGIQLQPNTDYRLKVQTSGTNPTTISMKIWPTSGSEPTGWQHIVTDSTPELQVAGGVGVRVNLAGAVSNTPIQYRFDDLSVKTLTTAPTSTGRLETVSAAVDANWTTVSLNQEYDSPVIACSIHYLNNSVPVVVRMQNVSSTSFDIRLQNPGDLNPIVADTVSCLVVEEGAWTLPDDRKVEAGLLNSTVTDRLGSWVGQRVNYSQSYSNPIVFGQVMSSNDARWSTFWNRGSSAVNPPSSSALYIGKQVAEDTDTVRLDETLGYIVFEAGSGTVESTAYEAMIGGDTVYDLTSPGTYSFSSAFGSTPAFVLTGQAGMDGGNGGWSYQFGSDSLTNSDITVAIDEDQIADSERLHTNEQVSYLVFESDLSISWGEEGPPPTVDPETVPLEIYARDDFGRTQFASWGFGNMGGVYVHQWGERAHEAFSVNGSEGLLVLNNNQNREAVLSKIKQQDFDVNFKFKTDKQAASTQQLFISARTVSNSSLYRLRMQIYPGGGVGLAQIKAANGAWSASPNQIVPGLTYTPGQYLNVRYQVVGINPTTLRAKVWADGTQEPADWHMSLIDSEAVLQATGSVGFKFFNRNGSNTTITYSMDDLFISNVTVLPIVETNRTSDVLWKPIQSQGSTIFLPITTNRSNGESNALGNSEQDQK